MLRSRIVAAGMLVVAVAVLAPVVPASAHDQLLSSSPSAGERLPSAPDEISLTFSADVLDLGAEVIVADSDGADWVATTPAVASGTVTVALKDHMPVAGYEVRWRVVSSDGHPISGVVPFTVGDAAPLARASAPAGEPPVVAAGSDTGVPRPVIIGAAGAVLALAVFAVVLLLRRRAARGPLS